MEGLALSGSGFSLGHCCAFVDSTENFVEILAATDEVSDPSFSHDEDGHVLHLDIRWLEVPMP